MQSTSFNFVFTPFSLLSNLIHSHIPFFPFLSFFFSIIHYFFVSSLYFSLFSPFFHLLKHTYIRCYYYFVYDNVIYSCMLFIHVPNYMKIAKVIQIYKKGEKDDVSNYRPISLLTSISIFFERIIYIRTVNFFKKSDIFSNFQFGFRENHSTTHALL